MKKILELKYIEYPIILLIFFILHKILFILSTVSQDTYFNSSILVGAFTDYKFLLLGLSVIVSIVFCQKLNITWNSIDESKAIRIFIMIVAGVLVWKYSTYDFNYFFNQSHYFDRFVLIGLFIALWFTPKILYAFLAMLFLIVSQFHYPIIGLSYTDQMPLFDILILFVAFLIVKQIKNIDIKPYIILAISLHAANYFIPGIAKLEISPNLYEWTFNNNLSNLFVSSYINGWLTFLSEETIMSIAKVIEAINIPALIFTLLVQVLAIFIFVREKIAKILLLGFEALHIGIFLASGIFFWKWILLNIGFIILISKLSDEIKKELFTKQTAYLAAIIIFFSPFYFKPPSLAWYDSKVNNYFEIVATDIDGNKYNLNRNFLSPYDQIFAQNRFFYTVDKPIITGTFGTVGQVKNQFTDREFFRELIKGKNEYKIKDYELFSLVEDSSSIKQGRVDQMYGKSHHNKEKYKTLKNFLTQYFTNYNNSDKSKRLLEYFGAPYHIYSYDDSNYQGEKIKKVELIYKETFYEDYQIKTIDSKKVMEILF